MARRKRSSATTVAVLTLIGAVLCTLAVGGFLLYPYYLLRPWIYHPVWFGVPGFLLLALACWLGLGRAAVKWAGVAVCLLCGATVGFIGWFAAAYASPMHAVGTYRAPDGDVEVVVYQSTAGLAPDLTWELRLHTRRGLLSRESDLGCVNSDAMALNVIQWIGPRTVRVGLSRAGAIDVVVDDQGRPNRTVDGGC
ncbi:hypothetical protein [Mycolicibacterium sp. J2]|uniref:hypothetical protein n=1 Tax=Mycolicibacterium sp. J2 TaxID=2993511 RepID=UPI00224A87FE|nr:hypothetical protein [Mycolicibacterium sp. J2]MCX2712891.1 hypothetical protein [Mycolicibacterium sp. J2]